MLDEKRVERKIPVVGCNTFAAAGIAGEAWTCTEIWLVMLDIAVVALSSALRVRLRSDFNGSMVL